MRLFGKRRDDNRSDEEKKASRQVRHFVFGNHSTNYSQFKTEQSLVDMGEAAVPEMDRIFDKVVNYTRLTRHQQHPWLWPLVAAVLLPLAVCAITRNALWTYSTMGIEELLFAIVTPIINADIPIRSGCRRAYARLAPKRALPILAECNTQNSPEVRAGIAIAFQSLVEEEAATLLSQETRKKLFQELSKCSNTTMMLRWLYDQAYADTVLTLLEQQPDESAREGLEKLPNWAHWSLVERSRKILRRLNPHSEAKVTFDPNTSDFASILRALAGDDSEIRDQATARLRTIAPEEIPALRDTLGAEAPEAKRKQNLTLASLVVFLGIVPQMLVMLLLTRWISLPEVLQYSPVYVTLPLFTLIGGVIGYSIKKTMHAREMVNSRGISYGEIPWLTMIEAVSQAENLEIVNELLQTEGLLGDHFGLTRSVRTMLMALLPRMQEPGAPPVDLGILHRELRTTLTAFGLEREVHSDELDYLAAIARLLQTCGDEQSLRLLQRLQKHTFKNPSLTEKKTDAWVCPEGPVLPDYAELDQAQKRFKAAVSEAVDRLSELIAAGHTPGNLLRASSAPVKSDTLLRPASKGSVTSPAELLRPTEELQQTVEAPTTVNHKPTDPNEEQVMLQSRNQS